jgi:hypothetical protein
MSKQPIFILILLSILFAGCKTTDESTADGDSGRPMMDVDGEIAEEYLREELNEMERTLYRTRSNLSDRFVSVDHDMPEIFQRKVVQEEADVNPYAGFRVQILSTRSVTEADSTRDNFMVWAGERFHELSPEAYVIFRQPYYRVRVGDFQERDRAIQFSRLLKQTYPEAWVVHDRIVPEDVPADSLMIEFSSPPDSTRQAFRPDSL